MRTKKAMFNVGSNLFIMIIRTVLLFIVRIIFIKRLGEVYLGIDSLFTNLLSVLSIAELGINTAINYTLYEPLAKKDYNQVSKLLSFYKRMYNCFGVTVFGIGMIIAVFLNCIVDVEISNLYLLYFLYLFNTASTYFISYKETLIIADQNNYKLTNINLNFYLLLYGLRLIFLLITKDFLIYVLILVVITLMQRITINRYVTKNYSFIDFNCRESLTKKEKKNIFKNVIAMFMHKVGNYLVNGTDSIIISSAKVLGVIYVGLYTNYLSIVNMTNSIFGSVYRGITSSYGNLAALENEETQENVFNIINFIGFLMYGICFVGFLFLLSPFIRICFGSNYELDKIVVFVICLNFYLSGMLLSIDLIKEATGTYKVDKFIPILQAIINLIFSILLVNKMGMLGVVLGTLISIVLTSLWNKPYIAYKHIFKSTPKHYIYNNLKYILVLVLTSIIIYYAFRIIMINNIIVDFIVKMILIIVVFTGIMLVVFFRNKEFKYVCLQLKKILRR